MSWKSYECGTCDFFYPDAKNPDNKGYCVKMRIEKKPWDKECEGRKYYEREKQKKK